MIKVKQREYLFRDIETEITPVNFESIKQDAILRKMKLMKKWGRSEGGIQLFKEITEKITFEEFEEYIGSDRSCEIAYRYLIPTEEYNICAIEQIYEFIVCDLKDGWTRGEIKEYYTDHDSWKVIREKN